MTPKKNTDQLIKDLEKVLGNFKYLDDTYDLVAALVLLHEGEQLIMKHGKHFTQADYDEINETWEDSPMKTQVLGWINDNILS